MKTKVFCKTSFEGVHRFLDAPEEVSHLRNLHRHIFHINVEIDVFHDDREIEFIMLKHKINDWLKNHLDENGVWQMDTLSCEQVAQMLIGHLSALYSKEHYRQIIITISEDNENGAIVSTTM